MPSYAPFSLEPTADRVRHNDALAAATGGRVGLEGVLAELDRTGRMARTGRAAQLVGVPTSSVFAWDLRDDLSRRWWPQGITTSADAAAVRGHVGGGGETYAGRRVLLTSSYSKVLGGVSHGARISVVDVTDPERVRYQHVLLVKAVADDDHVQLEPVHSHAGGLVWHGDHLHVAATGKGFHTFRLSDIVASGGLEASGHRYVLPLHVGHAARTDEGATPFRYSFLSSSTAEGRVSLLAGEYSPPTGRGSTRLVELAVDAATGLPALDGTGRARPALLGSGVRQAQGAVRVRGRLYVGSSNGRLRRGSVWVADGGRPAEPASFARRPAALPVGPEDLASWPSRDELWTVTEYPGRRRVVALDRARLDGRAS